MSDTPTMDNAVPNMDDAAPQWLTPPTAPKLSRLAVAAFFCSLFLTTSVGALGFLLGLAALVRLRRHSELCGRAIVRLAIFLGGLSLFCQFYQFPVATFTPPIAHADSEFRQHMDDLADGRLSAAYSDSDWPVEGPVTHVMFRAWVDDFAQRYGRLNSFWVLTRTRFPQPRTQYLAVFDKAGLIQVDVIEDATGHYHLETVDGQDVRFRLP